MNRRPPVDFAHYAMRPIPGGWVTRCKTCDEDVRLRTVEGVAGWQRHHECPDGAHVAATRREAQAILARLVPDPIDVVLQRRADLLAATARPRPRRAA